MNKKTILSVLLIALVSALSLSAQSQSFFHQALITPYQLNIGWEKTTVLIFPSPVQSADRGSRHILAQKDEKAQNVLKVKAAAKGFSESNLNVITADGKLYHFTVNYSDQIPNPVIDMGLQNHHETTAMLFDQISLNEAQVEQMAEKVAEKNPFMRKRDKNSRMKLTLQGIYIHEDVMFFQLFISNSSGIDFNTEQWRFFIRDAKQTKRTAVRELEMVPVFGYPGLTKGVSGKDNNTIVLAFEKFTIADSKRFIMQVFERNGDRNLTLSVKGKHLLKALPVSEYQSKSQ
ncbi:MULTISPECIES: conjugative transposon protein TraN [Cyclobacteriaceae]|uniref:Conjugative transposon protein TraN n=2 Tax=Cyclobacteriaceae TaxID=563798 RepID=A0ABV9T105_9BACT